MKDLARQNFTQNPRPAHHSKPDGLPAGGRAWHATKSPLVTAPGRTTPRTGFLVVALICAYLAGLLTAAAFGG